MTTRLRPMFHAYGLQLVVLVGVWTGFAVTTPSFRGWSSMYGVVEGFALLGLVAVGLSVTIFAGELDLSVSAMAGLAGVLAVRSAGVGLVGTLAIATLTGAVIGAVQGALIHKLVINSLVFTIGSQILLGGVAYVFAGTADLPLSNLNVSNVLLNRWSFLSPDSIVSLVVFLLIWLFISFTRRGREIQAIGGGRREAISAGVPVGRVIVLIFSISAACAALAGAIASIKGGGASPDGFSDLLLNAPAAILIGGVSLQDGRGTVLNVFLGVAILSVVTAGLGDRSVQSYVVDLVIGILLLVVVIAQFAMGKVEQRGPHRRPPAWSVLTNSDSMTSR